MTNVRDKHEAVADMILKGYVMEKFLTYTEATSQLLGAHTLAVRLAEAGDIEKITAYHEACIEIVLDVYRNRNKRK